MEVLNIDVDVNRSSRATLTFRSKSTVLFSLILVTTIVFIQAYVAIYYPTSDVHYANRCNISVLYPASTTSVSWNNSTNITNHGNLTYLENNNISKSINVSACDTFHFGFPTFPPPPPTPPLIT